LGTSLTESETIPKIKQFIDDVVARRVWWRKQATRLPKNYIQRKLSTSIGECNVDQLIEKSTADFVLLVNIPGMGKSTELTFLEHNLRRNIPNNRIIVRIVLKEVQNSLKNIQGHDIIKVLTNWLGNIPLQNHLQNDQFRLFLLLDGMDEVCPTYQNEISSLLEILDPKCNRFPKNQIKCILTSRHNYKHILKARFDMEVCALLPVSEEAQHLYIKSHGNLPDQEILRIRKKLPSTLLSTPLILKMLVDILNVNKDLVNNEEMNILELYKGFIDATHESYLVNKLNMNPADNFTKLQQQSMMDRNLNFYFYYAWEEIKTTAFSIAHTSQFPKDFHQAMKSFVNPPRWNSIRSELLQFGLLVENNLSEVRFKHRSFAEYFYSEMITFRETPQIVRDLLFGSVFGPFDKLHSVEEFLAEKTNEEESVPCFNLTSNWIDITNSTVQKCRILFNFATGKCFRHFAKQVMQSFVRGPDSLDSLQMFLVLVDIKSTEAFHNIYRWMEQNKSWTRTKLLNLSEFPSDLTSWGNFRMETSTARIITAVALRYESQRLFSGTEIKTALASCGRLLFIVSSIQNEKWIKWRLLERLRGLEIASIKKLFFENLVTEAENTDWSKILNDCETTWKLVSAFSEATLLKFFTCDQSRVSDIVGRNPLWIKIALGEEFLSNLCKFRVKFKGLSGQDKDKTVFEFPNSDFAFDVLWNDLLKEVEERNETGPITAALREAVINRSNWKVLEKLEQHIRRRRGCPVKTPDKYRNQMEVIDWIVENGLIWNQLTSVSIEFLPYVLCHGGTSENIDLFYESLNCFSEITSHQKLLTCLVAIKNTGMSSQEAISCLTQSKFPQGSSSVWNPVVQTLLNATGSYIKQKAYQHPDGLVLDISVGLVGFQLQNQPWSTYEDSTLLNIICDVIQHTSCCKLEESLSALTHSSVWSESLFQERLKSLLLQEQVFTFWRTRFSSYRRKHREMWDDCGLTGLLSFYFTTFENTLDWMKGEFFRDVLLKIPVEISNALRTNYAWRHLECSYEDNLRSHFEENHISSVAVISKMFNYKHENEWTWIIDKCIGWKNLRCGEIQDKTLHSATAVALLEALVNNMDPSEARKNACAIWKMVPPNSVFGVDTIESMGSFLHLATKLSQEATVRQWAWPGLLKWRNSEGKNALEIALDNQQQDTSILNFLIDRYNDLQEKTDK